MKILFSSKKKLIKLAEDERKCRLCGKTGESPGSVAVVPYSLTGEPTAVKIRSKKVPCTTCNRTGTIKSDPPTYTECPTCKPGAVTAGGVGVGPGVYRQHVCPGCYNRGTRLVPVHGGGVDEFEERPCPTCGGDTKNIPLKDCPTCVGHGSDKPGFIQEGESQHNILCPTCKGSTQEKVAEHYSPILQVRCPHDSIDTRTKPDGAKDELGPYDKNYFEGQRLLPLKLLWGIRGVGSKYHHERKEDVNKSLFDGSTREVGSITPPIPPVQSNKEPSYMEFLSRPGLLDPTRSRNASKLFKSIKLNFNSKIAKEEIPQESNSSNNDFSEDPDDFFGKPEEHSNKTDDDIDDFFPEGFSLDKIAPSKRTLSPEESKRLHGGPITVRQMDESDMTRPFLKNPSKAIGKTKSLLQDQKSLSEKRSRMSKMFKGMKAIDDEPDENVREKKRQLGMRPTFRGWRDNLQTVSENLDVFGQLRKNLREKLSQAIGKPMEPEIATALTSQAFRAGRPIPNKDGSIIDLSTHRMGITEPMPYFKNDENWRETHSGLGCDHDPGEGHEPDVGCLIDYHNSVSNPKNGVTTGVNSRLVTGKYTKEDGKTVLQTVGARLKRPAESGVAKIDLRGSTPKWTPENFGRIVELPAENATCVPNRIQREHYVVNHTVEPTSERSESTQLPEAETGIPGGLKSEPILNKEKVKFPEHIRQGGPTESVYVGNPLYQLTNPFSSKEVEEGMWANNPIVQHFAKQIKDGKPPEKFKPYIPEPKFNSQQMKTRPGLTGPPPAGSDGVFSNEIDIDSLFGGAFDDTPPKTSKKEQSELNPVETEVDDIYDFDKKIKVQKMQRTQVPMVEPTNPSTPDITPNVPQVNYN